jgi:hypothetical protein
MEDEETKRIFQMDTDRRKAVRRTVRLPAKIATGEGGVFRDCTLVDLSDLGARLAIDQADNLPDEFAIFLPPYARPFRKCRLIWRKNEHIGVEFDADWLHRFNAMIKEPEECDLPN